MKLINLLVQELPKRGGWPDGVDAVEQDSEGQLFEMESDYCSDFKLKKCDDWIADVVTKQQYESALAASRKSAWNGEGLPPVGMHCEIVDPDGVLMYGQGESGEVISHVENTAVIRMSYGLGCFEARFLRPLRSEAEMKHEAVLESICAVLEMVAQDYKREDEARLIYESIAAGKIPGVKLEE